MNWHSGKDLKKKRGREKFFIHTLWHLKWAFLPLVRAGKPSPIAWWRDKARSSTPNGDDGLGELCLPWVWPVWWKRAAQYKQAIVTQCCLPRRNSSCESTPEDCWGDPPTNPALSSLTMPWVQCVCRQRDPAGRKAGRGWIARVLSKG